MRKPTRLYTANDISNGVQVVHGLGLKAIQADPTAAGPLATLQKPQEAQQQAMEMAEGHCFGCGSKKSFVVQNKKPTKNGAIQASGPCNEPGCSTTISTFLKGASDAA